MTNRYARSDHHEFAKHVDNIRRVVSGVASNEPGADHYAIGRYCKAMTSVKQLNRFGRLI